MTPLVLFGSLVLVPAVIAVVLRINAAILFMSVCVGEVLVQYVAGDTSSVVATFSLHGSVVSNSTIRLALLLGPAILTGIVMIHSVHGGLKPILNILPALGFGLLVTLLVRPLLSPAFQRTLAKSSLWHQFNRAQTLVVGVSALFSLLFLYLQHHGAGESKHSLKKHHS